MSTTDVVECAVIGSLPFGYQTVDTGHLWHFCSWLQPTDTGTTQILAANDPDERLRTGQYAWIDDRHQICLL